MKGQFAYQISTIQRSIGRLTYGQWLLIILFIFCLSIFLGTATAYLGNLWQAKMERDRALSVDLKVQMELAQADVDAGRYNIALQRLDYILEHDPDYPGLEGLLVEVMLAQAENPDVVSVSVIEPTPTPDTRDIEELFAAAQTHRANQDWKSLLDTLLALRNADPYYQAVEIDRMLYLALRMQAEEEIINNGNLETGLYDLALAERFAPLDAGSVIRREWARLYLMGASFWNVFPEQALYYFRQLVFAAPYLHDANGFTSAERYRQALLQYGDQLAQQGEWCEAQAQYEAALPMSPNDPTVETRATDARDRCENPVTPTVEVTSATPTLETGSPTAPSPTLELTLSPTPSVETTTTEGVTPTSENTPTLTPTSESPPTLTPTSGSTQTPSVTPSQTPTVEPSLTVEASPTSP